ncbi:MAG TPA: hypothetical protein VJ825_00620 [Gemmatimonadaceae bacterium]|nr:hypothetical protein [Gemmatimonadaceae bacterium]
MTALSTSQSMHSLTGSSISSTSLVSTFGISRLARQIANVAIIGAFCLAGCTSGEAKIRVDAWLPAPLSPAMLTVNVSDGRSSRTLTGGDFQLVGGFQYHGPTIETSNQGTLKIDYVLVPVGSTVPVSSGSVELPLRPDWSYGVTIRPDSADPRRFCFGCQGAKAFPLAPAFRISQTDSIYVVWGGNSIRHPVIY